MNYIKYQTTDDVVHKNTYSEATTEIDLSSMDICKIIEINGLKSLIRLNMLGNKMTKIEGLDSLTSLQGLYLGRNQITKLEGLNCLISLQELYLSDNNITKIEGLDNLTSLLILDLENNNITKIEGLDNLPSLQELHLGRNQITKIKGLDNLMSLQILDLFNNNIAKIEGLDSLPSLQELDVSDNKIQNIPISIINLRSLHYLDCDIPLNLIIERFLNRNQIKSNKTIYNDKQNVHDHQINKSITESLYRLLDEKVDCTDQKIFDEITNDSILSSQSKEALIEYLRIPDIHSQLNVTFMEALKCVWTVIREHKQSNEIKKVLDQEVQDSICKCFTGRLSRLVNTLNGFDEKVSVWISDSQEISNVIISIRQKTNNIEEQQLMITSELAKRGYDSEIIGQWLAYL
jgi:Leucine-rich repeat (LRR) protein